MSNWADYNWFNDPRNYDYGPNLRGAGSAFKAGMDSMLNRKRPRSGARWAFKGSRSTKVTRKSVAKQRTITAPMARRIDTKYYDYPATISGLKNTAPQVWMISSIAQGAAESQRIGNDIRILKLIVSVELVHGTSAEDQTFRFLLICDKTANNNTALTASSVFNSDGGGNITPQSLRNVTNLEDYQILLDKMIRIDSNYNAAHGRKINQFEVKTSIGQRFSGSASTTIVKNPICAVLLTNSTNTTTGASGYLMIRQIYSDVC